MSEAHRGGWFVAIVLMLCAASVSVWAQTSRQTASEFYMSYRAAFDKAKAIEELFPHMSKDVRAEIEATPADQRAEMFELAKEMQALSNVKVVQETKTADGVTLTVEAVANNEERTGQIQIVDEDGAWKIGRQRWSSKS
jgi:hypothetical protein